MPISYEIDRARNLVRTRCFGETTLGEVVKHFADLRADTQLPSRLNVLLDLTALVSPPERDQLRVVVGEIRELGTALRWGVIAIAARSDLVFGMSRILGVFVEDSFSNTGVFRQVREAELWLESQLGTR